MLCEGTSSEACFCVVCDFIGQTFKFRICNFYLIVSYKQRILKKIGNIDFDAKWFVFQKK